MIQNDTTALKPYIRPILREAKAMTIVVGFRCTDGIIICADRQVSLIGHHKYYECKISREADIQFTDLVFAYSGLPGLAREAQEKIVKTLRLREGEITTPFVGEIIDEVLTNMGRQYAELELRLLVGASVAFEAPELWKFDGTSLHVADNFNVLGVGDRSLTRFLSEKMYLPTIDLENGKNLAAYLIKKAVDHIDHCGGPIDVAVLNYLGEIEYLPDTDIVARIEKMESRERFLNNVIIRGDFSST